MENRKIAALAVVGALMLGLVILAASTRHRAPRLAARTDRLQPAPEESKVAPASPLVAVPAAPPAGEASAVREEPSTRPVPPDWNAVWQTGTVHTETDMLEAALGLTPGQKERIRELIAARNEGFKSITDELPDGLKPGAITDPAMQEELLKRLMELAPRFQQVADAYEAGLRGVLTPAQLEKCDQMRRSAVVDRAMPPVQFGPYPAAPRTLSRSAMSSAAVW